MPPSSQKPPRIGILCVGNILLMDEGIGPHVASKLHACYELPSEVCVLDRGTMGMALLSDLKEHDIILLVDAVDNTGEPPGTVVTFSPSDIAPYEAWHGAHDTRFIDVLQAAQLLGYNIEAYCLGMQVQNMRPPTHTIGLTAPVAAAMPALIQAILDFLTHYSIELMPKKVK